MESQAAHCEHEFHPDPGGALESPPPVAHFPEGLDETFLAAIVAASNDAIIGKSLDGVVFSWNAGAERLYGYTAEEMIGRSIRRLFPADRADELPQIIERLRRGERVEGFETVRLRKDGRRVDVSVTISPVNDRGGAIVGASAIARDISHRRQAERALQASEERFAAFMRHLPGAAWMKDLDGRYVYANPEAERIFDRGLEQLRGRTDEQVFPAETARQFRENDRRALRAGGFERVESLRQPDGVDHQSIVRKFVVPGADGKPAFVGGVAFDITVRLAAEKALRDSEEGYRRLVQSLPAAVYTCDAQGRITLYNEAAVALWGAAPELGKTRWCGSRRIYTPDDEPMAPDQYPMAIALREGSPVRGVEIVIERPDGSRRHVLAHPDPIFDDAGNLVGAINMLMDITGRKRVEEALRASESLFRLMADTAPTLIWMSGADQACTWFNRRWLEYTGRTMDQELGDGWTEGVHPDDLRTCLEVYRGAFGTRAPFEMEYRLRRFDGEYRWVHDSGVPLRLADGEFAGYIGSCIDVTDRKRGEALLRERVAERTRELSAANEQLNYEVEQRRRIESLLATENRILELIASGADLAEMLDALCEALEGLIPGVRCAIRLAPGADKNGAVEANTDNPTNSLAGVDMFGALARVRIHLPLRAERTVVSSVRSARRPRATKGVREHGFKSYWLEPIPTSDGKVLGTLGVYSVESGRPGDSALDMTAMAARLAAIALERARAEERAQRQLSQLAHVARLATMGELASGLAHELNQPLCAIVNFVEASLELARADGAGTKELRGALAEVARQAQRAGEVIRRLREFVRRREPEREPIDLNSAVREVVALTAPEARNRGVRVRLRLGARLPRVLADTIQVQQVLVNLVRNGFDALHSAEARKRVLTIQTVRRDKMVELAVADCGLGLAAEQQERLFEPFFSTKPDGMGMGLSISRSILEALDGQIWAEPNRAGGATFRLTLPRAGRTGRRGRG